MAPGTRMFLWGFGTAAAIAAFILLTVLYSGSYNVAANDPHTSIMRWALGQTINSSVHKATEALEAPDNFSDEQVARGAVLFADSCAHCHGAPGMEQNAWSGGMLPQPPDLADHADHMETKKAYWIIRNGLKFTGMPAFAEVYDEPELWSLTAFVTRLDEMSAEQYAALTAPEEPAGPDAPDGPEADARPGDAPVNEQTTPAESEPAEAVAAEPEQSEPEQPAGTSPAEAETVPGDTARIAPQPAEPEPSQPEQSARPEPAAKQSEPAEAPEPPEAEQREAVRPETRQPEPATDAPGISETYQEAPAQSGPAQAGMADGPASAIPIPPRMETVQTVTDESKLEPSLRPLPPAPRNESQWPAR